MTCAKCKGVGFYFTDPVECRDGKKRRTKLNCDCGTTVDDPTAILSDFKTELRMTRAVCESLDGQLRRADNFRRRTRDVVAQLDLQIHALRRALDLLRTRENTELYPRLSCERKRQIAAEYLDATRTLHEWGLLSDTYTSPSAGLFDD